jgi:hypothetical protein
MMGDDSSGDRPAAAAQAGEDLGVALERLSGLQKLSLEENELCDALVGALTPHLAHCRCCGSSLWQRILSARRQGQLREPCCLMWRFLPDAAILCALLSVATAVDATRQSSQCFLISMFFLVSQSCGNHRWAQQAWIARKHASGMDSLIAGVSLWCLLSVCMLPSGVLLRL